MVCIPLGGGEGLFSQKWQIEHTCHVTWSYFEIQKNFARSNPARSKTALDRLFLKVPTFCPLFSYLNDLGSFEHGSIEIPARSFHFFDPVTVSTTASIEFFTLVTSRKSRRWRQRMKPRRERKTEREGERHWMKPRLCLYRSPRHKTHFHFLNRCGSCLSMFQVLGCRDFAVHIVLLRLQ